ncbi:class I SAM-dependent methyltransferase [Priestia taiwanensis]|uniref:rRNA methyltransferase n=1 Tax=Priestia taiwanensis TaxID=1347902 RepID=A0A917AXD6_9BACI|nr:class I SAM-dependent methyltransferase [Priestia taiwanensis]MBM7363349.1 tRNA A58 N-methylase Trm61 [Priestia taiwanensis]GGE77879.1 rRNA methyltransferase [Priestia taiwanensis]
MKLERILPFARTILQKAISEGNVAVDATMGNGHDTHFLAELVGESGHVFAYDIQQEAITNTTIRLQEHHVLERTTLLHESHAKVAETIPAHLHGNITAAIFNLGYLPGGDKHITTAANSTIEAIEKLLEIMAFEGIIVLVIYHGHPEGQVERDELLHYVQAIPQEKAHILQYQFINQVNNPPFIVAIEKR